jgi:glycosyltransferase involved in cell wall biosynthesis
MRPSYAVITATLNAELGVGAAIDSVLEQSVLPTQYIVIDGGSSDRTVDEAASRGEEIRRNGVPIDFRILRQTESGGIAGAWNEAIAACTADVVFLLNADDTLDPGAAAAVLKAFDEHPDAEIVHANARFLREDGSPLGICRPSWINRVGLQCRTVHCATFVRRSVYQRVGGFDERFRTTLDFDFIERCHAAGVRFRHLDVVTSNFRLGGVSNSLRGCADWETLKIGLRHSTTKIPPILAYLVRRCLMRPIGLAGFHLRLQPEHRRAPVPAVDGAEARIVELRDDVRRAPKGAVQTAVQAAVRTAPSEVS